jgi:HEAT repeat protein
VSQAQSSTPQQRIAAECARHGTGPLTAGCVLLHQWDPAATAAITGATHDEAWRVREMAAKVIASHRVGDALNAVAALRSDPVERVRAAAARAVTLLTAAGA